VGAKPAEATTIASDNVGAAIPLDLPIAANAEFVYSKTTFRCKMLTAWSEFMPRASNTPMANASGA